MSDSFGTRSDDKGAEAEAIVVGGLEAGIAGDFGPEGTEFVPAVASPAGESMLLVANQISGTTIIYRVSVSG